MTKGVEGGLTPEGKGGTGPRLTGRELKAQRRAGARLCVAGAGSAPHQLPIKTGGTAVGLTSSLG